MANKIRITTKQIRILVQYMEEHPNLASGRVTPQCTKSEKTQRWAELTELLNSQDGCQKTTAKWMKTWSDMKVNAKRYAEEVRKGMKKTTSHSARAKDGYAIEERILALIDGTGPLPANVEHGIKIEVLSALVAAESSAPASTNDSSASNAGGIQIEKLFTLPHDTWATDQPTLDGESSERVDSELLDKQNVDEHLSGSHEEQPLSPVRPGSNSETSALQQSPDGSASNAEDLLRIAGSPGTAEQSDIEQENSRSPSNDEPPHKRRRKRRYVILNEEDPGRLVAHRQTTSAIKEVAAAIREQNSVLQEKLAIERERNVIFEKLVATFQKISEQLCDT